jgi:hypothetical protein
LNWRINNGSTLYKINKQTAQTTQIATLPKVPNGIQRIEFAPDGTLYGVNSGTEFLFNPDTLKYEIKKIRELFTLDKTTGERLKKIADLDSSIDHDIDYAPDGFIYFISSENQLIQVNPNNGSSKVIKDKVEGDGIASLPVVPSITPINDPGGNTLETAHLLALDPFDTTKHTVQGYVGNINEIDPLDLYRIELSRSTDIEIILTDLVGDADLTLLNEAGSIEWGFRNFSNKLINNEERYSAVLSKGTYYIQIKAAGTVETTYKLSINSKPQPVSLLSSVSEYGYSASASEQDKALEFNSYYHQLNFSFYLSEPSDRAISFDYQTLDGSAIAGKDYESINGTVTFAPGETKQQISVPVIDDGLEEYAETLFLRLSNPKNISLLGYGYDYDPAQTRIEAAIIYQSDNDNNSNTNPPNRLRWIEVTQITGVGQDWILEAQKKAIFTVKLNGVIEGEVTVDYFTLNGSAKAGEDYQQTNGRLTFNKDSLIQTVEVTLIDNQIGEETESFSLNFRNISENAGIDSPHFVAEIKDEDQDTILITKRGSSYGRTFSLSKDGNYVAFSTDESLVPEDTNGRYDVYIYNRSNGNVRLISIATDGTAGNGDSFARLISDDGTAILFSSEATNLSDSTGGIKYVRQYVRQFNPDEPTLGTTIPVKSYDPNPSWEDETQIITPDGTDLTHLFWSNLSDDGRYRALSSRDSNDKPVLLIKDLVDKTTTQAEISYAQTSSLLSSFIFQDPIISGNGRFIAFISAAALIANDTNLLDDIFVYDIETKTIERVSVASDGTQRNGSDRITLTGISDDGRYVAFISDASNLVKNDTNGYSDIFVRDRQTGKTILGSLNADGTQFYDDVEEAFLSDDGQSVAYIYESPAESQLFVRKLNYPDDNNNDTVTITGKVEWTDSAGNKPPIQK